MTSRCFLFAFCFFFFLFEPPVLHQLSVQECANVASSRLKATEVDKLLRNASAHTPPRYVGVNQEQLIRCQAKSSSSEDRSDFVLIGIKTQEIAALPDNDDDTHALLRWTVDGVALDVLVSSNASLQETKEDGEGGAGEEGGEATEAAGERKGGWDNTPFVFVRVNSYLLVCVSPNASQNDQNGQRVRQLLDIHHHTGQLRRIAGKHGHPIAYNTLVFAQHNTTRLPTMSQLDVVYDEDEAGSASSSSSSPSSRDDKIQSRKQAKKLAKKLAKKRAEKQNQSK